MWYTLELLDKTQITLQQYFILDIPCEPVFYRNCVLAVLASTHQYCTQYPPVLYSAVCAQVTGNRRSRWCRDALHHLLQTLPRVTSSKRLKFPDNKFFLTQRMKNIFPLPRSTWIIQSCISLQRSRPNWPHVHICTQSATESVTITTTKTMLNFLVLVFVVFSCFVLHVLCDFNRVHHISHLPEKFSPQLSPFTTTGEWMNLNCHKNLQTTSWTMWF